MAKKDLHEWSKEAFYIKAQRYVQTMMSKERTDWQFGLWSVLTMEMLVKAAIAHISPTLIAEGKDWNNVLYAIGRVPTGNGFNPRSKDCSFLFQKAAEIFPDFTKELLNFSIIHLERRNGELHSGVLPFDGLGSSVWLSKFYLVCTVLLSQIGVSQEAFFGEGLAKEAKACIAAMKDENAKQAIKIVKAHKTIWDAKTPAEKDKASKQSDILSMRQIGHRVSCPACSSQALVKGDPVGPPKVEIDDGVTERQSMLPSSFQCVACGLKIEGYSKLVECGLGDTYISTVNHDVVEYFNINIEEKYRDLIDYPDNNE